MARDPNSLFKPLATTRRGFLLSGVAVAAVSVVGCGGGDDEPVVSTSSGWFRGQVTEGVTSFLGIP